MTHYYALFISRIDSNEYGGVWQGETPQAAIAAYIEKVNDESDEEPECLDLVAAVEIAGFCEVHLNNGIVELGDFMPSPSS